MTESGWTDVTVHSFTEDPLTVRVQADTPQDAARLLDPFMGEDIILAGAGTTREQAVNALLQSRLIRARAELEAAQQQYDQALTNARDYATITTAEAAADNAPTPACNAHVYWWDGEYEGNCELRENHDGPHHDGNSWYAGEGAAAEQVAAPAEAERP